MSKIKGEKAIKRLASRIKNERKEQGLTQTELSHLSGTSLNFINQLEQGKPTVRLDKLVDVLLVLGLELRVSYGKKAVVA